MPWVTPPIAIDDPTKGNAPPQGLNNGAQVKCGPFIYGGALYQLLQTGNFPTYKCDVFKSTDNGLTWVGLDIGSCGSTGNFGASFDGVHTVRVAWAGVFAPGSIAGAQVQDFDLSAGTWGAASGAGGPNANFVWACEFLGSGSTLVILSSATLVPNLPLYRGVIWSGVWGAPFDLTTKAVLALGAIDNNTPGFSYVMDAAKAVMHACFLVETTPALASFLCYQAINQNGTLGPFVSFSNGGGTFGLPANPGIFGDNIVLAYSDAATLAQGIWVGTPIAAPAFTNFPAIDPGLGADPTLVGAGNGFPLVIGTTLYLIYTVQSVLNPLFNPADRIRLLQTTNSAFPQNGWSGVTAFDGLTQGGAGWTRGDLLSPLVLTDLLGTPSITVSSDSTTTPGTAIRYWIGSAPGSPLTLTGVPPAGMVAIPYASCLSASGGTPPYGFTITSGALPPGLSLGPLTGCITGTPSLAGIYSFTVTVTDSLGATASVSPSLTITSSLFSRVLSGSRRKDCPPSVKTDLDWGAFSQAVEDSRPPDVEEVRVPPSNGMLRTN